MANVVAGRDVLRTILVAEGIFLDSQFVDKNWSGATGNAQRLKYIRVYNVDIAFSFVMESRYFANIIDSRWIR